MKKQYVCLFAERINAEKHHLLIKKEFFMKKNIIKAALVAVVGLIAGINVFNAQKLDVLSDVAMANVEALAQVQNSGSTITGNFLVL